jgi:hypothetical protein
VTDSQNLDFPEINLFKHDGPRWGHGDGESKLLGFTTRPDKSLARLDFAPVLRAREGLRESMAQAQEWDYCMSEDPELA